MKTILLNLLLLFISTSLFSCKKDDDQSPEPPPITAENTFSCKIDGELFIPEDFSNFPNSEDGYNVGFPLESNNWFSQFRNRDRNMYIYIYNITGTGIYEITPSDGDSFFGNDEGTVIEFSENTNLESTHKSTINSGTIEILEYVPLEKIVFRFSEITLVGIDNPDDVIVLSDGKGNFNLNTFNN